MLSEFLERLEYELNLFPSFVVPFLEFQEVFAIILTLIITNLDTDMKFFKRLLDFISHP